jgi:transcriptional regulator with XRE-family HTH domain
MVERIRTLLESRQLTPTQFADLIGVARPIISHVLSGRNKPSLDVVQRILAAMPDLSMAWLLNGTEPMLTTAREAAAATPVTTAPLSAEFVASARPVASPKPAVAPAQTSPPVAPVQYEQYEWQVTVGQDNNSSVIAPETAWATVSTPVVTRPSVVAAPVVAASPAPVARPANPAASRPSMPRRFPVKPLLAEQPAPASAPQAPVAPVPSIPAGIPPSVVGLVPSSVGPVEIAAMVASGVEDAVKESITHGSVVPGNLLGTNGASLVGAVPVVPAGAGAVAPAGPTPVASAMPAAGMLASAPAPLSVVGTVLNAAPTLASDVATALFTGAEKPIRRIVIFYRDGSFTDYQPE